MATQIAVDENGNYLGTFVDAQIPDGAIAVAIAPERADQVWDFQAESWSAFTLINPRPLDAAMRALTPDTPEFGVFSWLRGLAAQHLAIAQARSDINANLQGLEWWARNPTAASAGLNASFSALWQACEDLEVAIPEGYADTVAAWRTEFGLDVE